MLRKMWESKYRTYLFSKNSDEAVYVFHVGYDCTVVMASRLYYEGTLYWMEKYTLNVKSKNKKHKTTRKSLSLGRKTGWDQNVRWSCRMWTFEGREVNWSTFPDFAQSYGHIRWLSGRPHFVGFFDRVVSSGRWTPLPRPFWCICCRDDWWWQRWPGASLLSLCVLSFPCCRYSERFPTSRPVCLASSVTDGSTCTQQSCHVAREMGGWSEQGAVGAPLRACTLRTRPGRGVRSEEQACGTDRSPERGLPWRLSGKARGAFEAHGM